MNINFVPFPILATNRLILRELLIQDSEELFRLRSDDDVNAYLDREKPTGIADVKAFISTIRNIIENKEGVYWVITHPDNDKLIGTVCYWNLDLENDTAEIGYELIPDYQGFGFMQEAIQKVMEYGFNAMQLKEITAFPRKDNINSIKLLKRNGFDFGLEDGNYLKYYLKNKK